MTTAHFARVVFACIALTCASARADQAPAKPRDNRSDFRPKVLRPVRPRAPRPPVAKKLVKRPVPLRNSRAIRPPGIAGIGAPPLANAPHHGPNPAVLSGSAKLNTRSTSALDGGQLRRRP